MTLDPEIGPVYVLRAYAWQLLKYNMPDVWDEEKYGGNVPIVPLSEESDLEEFSGPHIVYGFADDSPGPLYAQNAGSATFAIYDENFRRLGRTLIILKTAFERQDEAAGDVNLWSSQFDQFRGIRFGFIDLGFTEGGTPEETEGGRQSALINIRYEYYVDYNVSTSHKDWV